MSRKNMKNVVNPH